jgi:hypothetical protein
VSSPKRPEPEGSMKVNDPRPIVLSWQSSCFFLPTIASVGHFSVFGGLSSGDGLTENDTTGSSMRIRFIGLPRDGDFDEFDLRRFRVGDIYDVSTQLATLLIIAGYAELVSHGHQIAEAADFGQIRFPKSKHK